MTRSILCGVDGSTDARLALRAAAQLSAQLDVRLVVAHVVQMLVQSPRLGPATIVPPIGAELDAGKNLLEHVLEEEGLADVEHTVVWGFPADRLADLADEEEAELIVVGSRGRGAFKSAILGSVSTDLIGVARCPVLVIPPGAAPGPGSRERGDRRRLRNDHDWTGGAPRDAASGDRRRPAGGVAARTVASSAARASSAVHSRGSRPSTGT